MKQDVRDGKMAILVEQQPLFTALSQVLAVLS